jgi:glycosyltransferase involved in cell wall biosynthesis
LSDRLRSLTHVVSLEHAAGVEVQFAEFVRHAVSRHPHWKHGWLNPARSLHESLKAPLGQTLAFRADAKQRGWLRLPSKPDWIRAWHCRRLLAALGSDVVMIWNRTARIGFVLDAVGAENCIHYEHGAAWFGGRERERRDFFRRVPHALANSKAAARVLEKFWDYTGEIRVCRNALRPSLVPEGPVERRFPRSGKPRIGVVARLFPVKGVPLALHAIKALVARGIDVELHVAGEGPERERLQALASRLGLAARTRFHGRVAAMGAFYRSLDCLLHLPTTEAFGLVAIEAAAHGCPVVAAAVDGLPEAVESGVTGYCVAPTLPLGEYTALGGVLEGMPAVVYDPAADDVREPRVVDPAAAAEAVQRLFATEQGYERIAAAASAHVLREFRFDAHVDAVMSTVAAFATR